MSTTPRSADLGSLVIVWLGESVEVTDRLGDGGGIVLAASVRDPEVDTDVDPRVSVAVRHTTSERQNRHEAKTFEARAVVDASSVYIAENGVQGLTELKDVVTDVLTRQRPSWRSGGVLDDQEVAYSDGIGRYVGVVSATIMRRDPRE